MLPRLLGATLLAAGVVGAGTATLAPTDPTVSPDGSTVAWVEGLSSKIWEAAPDGSGARVVASAPTAEGVSDMQWTSRGLVVDSNFTLFLLRPGQKPRALQPAGFSFAAGGTRVASGPERGPGRLVVTDLVTGRQWRMGSPKVNNSGAALSPDGARVAWTEPGGIWIGNVGGIAHRLAARAGLPRWSPDGKWLTFLRLDGLHLIASSGGRSRLLAPKTAGLCQSMAWSPGSTAIACASSDLVVVDVRTGARRRPAQALGRTVQAAWAPDGSVLYVVARPLADEQNGSNCLNLWRLDSATLRGSVVVQGCPD